LTDKLKTGIVYLVTALFIALNIYLVVKKQEYWGFLIPLAIYVAILYIISLDKILLLITFLTPLAINMMDFEWGIGISIPTEPLLIGVFLLFIIKVIFEHNYDGKILKHPVTIAILINLAWIFLTGLTSQLPLVSFKFLFARLWFVIPMFFVAIPLFKKESNISLFAWMYALPLIIVIGYTIFNHQRFGFDEDSGHWVMSPFYNDHTAYGAILAMFIPVFSGFAISTVKKPATRLVSLAVTCILTVALILSYSRAAWVSLGITTVIWLIILMKIKFKYLVVTFLSLVGLFYLFQFEIIDRLEKNKQDSSANFLEHIQSISNISSDASNLERINRWQSAIRMFNERPVFGFGPGTYQFEYAPYQRSKEKTTISTNAGDRGNAHSEYFGPLAESGLLGMLTFIGVVLFIIITALRVYKEAENKEIKLLSLVLLLGLFTYLLHGIMNNFLDSDKASIPFWGFVAAIVAMDLYHRKSVPKQ